MKRAEAGKPRQHWVADRAYSLLVRTVTRADRSRLGRLLWAKAWAALGRHFDVVETDYFGARVRFQPTSVYPIYSRRFPDYNSVLIEVVHQAADTLGRAVDVVDVGAAMGDTALLLTATCGSDVRRIACIEGDPLYAEFSRWNLRDLPSTVLIEAALSDGSEDHLPALERNPTGTAIATGPSRTAATTLDRALEELIDDGFQPAVLKIDVDGYDGRVLGGAHKVIRRFRPVIAFEWDPGSFIATGSDWRQPFEVVAEHGYGPLLWFTKFGDFNHFMSAVDLASVEAHAQFCLETTVRHEWHYDIVAIPSEMPLPWMAVADLGFARQAKARHR